jgi:hypothetical protein
MLHARHYNGQEGIRRQPAAKPKVFDGVIEYACDLVNDPALRRVFSAFA